MATDPELLIGMPLLESSDQFAAGFELGVLAAIMADPTQKRAIRGPILRCLEEQLHIVCSRTGWKIHSRREWNATYFYMVLTRR